MKKLTKQQKRKPDQLEIRAAPDKVEEVTARVMSEPETRSAAIIQKFEGDSLDITSLARELNTQTALMQSGDMSRSEAMLGAQAHALDALFSNLARRAHSNMASGYGEAAERYMRLALKAQSQAVRTVEVLGELKYPKHIAFVAQANISNGHQQINNGQAPRARSKKIEQNKLPAGEGNELSQNQRASSYECRVNSEVAALGKVHGA